ncbi:hypothetical protein ACHAQA_010172 [Verticillium albo-atrum]
MAEPLGIVGVIGVAAQIIQVAIKLGLDWKDAPADAKRFISEIESLKAVLSVTYTNILVNDDFKNAFHGQHSTLLTLLGDTAGPTDTALMVSACKQELDALLRDLTNRSQGHRVGWERIKGAFLAKKTRETVENLQRQCATLNSLVAVDALALAVHTHKEVKEARKEQQGWQADRENEAILDWLTTVDYSTQHSDFLRRRQEGTGQWLLDSAEYQQWIEATQQTLFCPGIPGAGKTILASIAVDDLHGRFRDDRGVGVAFLYCNFRREADQKVEDLLSSLLKQLSHAQASLPDCVRALYDKHKGKTRPSLDELSRALQIVAKLFARAFVVVDALDECHLSDGNRSKFLTEIFALQSASGANIFATSRFVQNITDRFKDSVSLEIRAYPEDVRRYLEGNMAHMPTCDAQNSDLRDEIITKIVQAVDGMYGFLLAQLYLDSLKGKRSPRAVRKVLETLHAGPQAYDRAYNDAIERIKGQLEDEEELAMQVLSWIICAKRPLSTTELQHALGVELGERELYLDNLSPVKHIISVCAGLVTVDEESSIIRLVHYTTQEYFMRMRTRWFPKAQVEITEACATYLSFHAYDGGASLTDAEFEDRLRSDPLYHYASHFWGDHAREAGEASQGVLGFLEHEKHVEAQVQALMTVKQYRPTGYSQKFPKEMRGLHVAAYFGIEEAIKDLLNRSDKPDMKDGSIRTPLSWAAANGRDAVVKVLLDTQQVHADSIDNNGRTPLSWAAANGHEAVVKMLLDTEQVDADSKDNNGRTPLSWAAASDREAIVKMFFDTQQVDVDLKDNNGRTPLSWAAEYGHEAVVKMLVDTKQVEVDSKDNNGCTPLSSAIAYGYEAVVKTLLDTGQVEVDSKDEYGLTQLWWAVIYGHNAVVKMLLDTGQVDVELRYYHGWTPLSWAIVCGNDAMVKMLVDTKQVDINSRDASGQTPLLLASERGQENVIKVLLGIADINIAAEDACGLTALQLSAFNHYEGVERLLLAYGAPVASDFYGLQNLFQSTISL